MPPEARSGPPPSRRPVREPDSSHGCGRLSGMDHVDVDGVRIAYTRAGTGPALVMVHGAPCDSRAWQWVLPDLSRDHTVIAWDAPGFGGSSDIDENWRAPRFADALAGFIAALDLEQPYLVGWSFGTMVALSLFQRHPAVPAGLVLVGGYAGWAGSLTPDEVARRRDMFIGMAELGDAFDPRSYPGLFTDLIPADRDAELATMMRENVRPATVRAGGVHRRGDRSPAGAAHRRRSHAHPAWARPTPGRRWRTPRRSMLRSRDRGSSYSRSSGTPAWWRTPRLVRRRSAGS